MTLKMYIAVLDEFPDHMVPTLVGHAVLRHHLEIFNVDPTYDNWLSESFRKVVVRVNEAEFDKIRDIAFSRQSWENNTLGGRPSCVTVVVDTEVYFPNVLKFAKLWKPKE